MKKKGCLLGVVAAVLAVLVPVVALKVRDFQLERDYQTQLDNAWAAGLPTTPEQFMTLLPVVKPAENAGPIYRKMGQVKTPPRLNTTQLLDDLTFKRTPGNLLSANLAIKLGAPQMKEAAKAELLPHCRFDRNWSQGAALLLPEFSNMRTVGRLWLMEGAIAAPSDSKLAIAKARQTLSLCRHLREEPMQISHLVASSIENVTLRSLASWAFKYSNKEYVEELKAVNASIPEVDLKSMHAFQLVSVLTLIDLTHTEKGLSDLGLTEDDIKRMSPSGLGLIRTLQSPHKGRTMIVSGMLHQWKSLEGPPEQMNKEMQQAREEVDGGLVSFPVAAEMYRMLGPDVQSSGADFVRSHESRRVANQAYVRALEGGKPKRSIDTSDLLSPYDGKPITYRFDGKTMSVDVRSGQARFQIPLPPP